MEQAINTIYILADSPEAICSKFMHSLTQQALPPTSIQMAVNNYDEVAAPSLTRLFFAAGHIAVSAKEDTCKLEISARSNVVNGD